MTNSSPGLIGLADPLGKVSRILRAASTLVEDVNLAEREPLATVISLAEDELDTAIAQLDACRLELKGSEAA
jgi:hypothetical protein